MSGTRLLSTSSRTSRVEKSVSTEKLGASVKDRRLEWEAKVRASVVTNVVRGPSGSANIAESATGKSTAGLDLAKPKPAGAALPPSGRHVGQIGKADESKGAGRRRAQAAANGSRANWEAQVRASVVTGVLRGPVDASCGRTTYDDTDLGASATESADDLGFLAHRHEIARKVDDTEAQISSVLEKLRNDLREMQEEDVQMRARLENLHEQVKDVDSQLETLCYSYVCDYPREIVTSPSDMSLVSSESQNSEQLVERDAMRGDQTVYNREAVLPQNIATPVSRSSHSGDSGLSVNGSHETSESESDESKEGVFEDEFFSDGEKEYYQVKVHERNRTSSVSSGIHGNELIDLYLRKERSIQQELKRHTPKRTSGSNQGKRDSGFVENCATARPAGSAKPAHLTRGQSLPTIRTAAILNQGATLHTRSFHLTKISGKQTGAMPVMSHESQANTINNTQIEISC